MEKGNGSEAPRAEPCAHAESQRTCSKDGMASQEMSCQRGIRDADDTQKNM